MSYCIVSGRDLLGEYRTEIAVVPINKGDRVVLTHLLTISGKGRTRSAFIVTQDQECIQYANTVNFDDALVAFNARLKLAKDVDKLRDNIRGKKEVPKCLHRKVR